MPRPSPEVRTQTFMSVYKQYGYQPSYTYNTYDTYRRVWTGSNSPGYPDELRVNPHHSLTLWYRREPETIVKDYKSQFNWFEQTGPMRAYGVSDPSDASLQLNETSVLLEQARRSAKSRLISKVSRQKVNIAQNIGEYRQVQSMFLTNTLRMVNAYRAIRHGDVQGLSRALKLSKRRKAHLERVGSKSLVRNPSAWWLELQYGWLPLLGDVYTGVTTFYSRMEQGARIGVKATASLKETVAASNVAAVGIVRYDSVTQRKAVCSTGVTFWVDDARLANAQDWGIINPLLLAWELLPYSFVVDWFLPVGNWLATLDYSLGLTFDEGYEGIMVKAEETRFYKPVPATPPRVRTVKGSDVFGGAYFKRYKLSSFPTAPLPTPDPGGLRGKRIANAMALLGVTFGKQVTLDLLTRRR